MVHDHLPAEVTEAAEVSVEGRGVAMTSVEVERVAVVILTDSGHIEAGVVVHTAAVEVAGNALNVARKLTKTVGIDLGAGQKSGVQERAVRVEERREYVLNSVDLSSAQASGVVVVGTVQGTGVEVADGGVLNDAVGNTVESLVALLLDLGLNEDPLVLGKEGVGALSASELDEACAPALQVLEVGRCSAGDNTIEIGGVVVGGVNALGTTSGATNVVGVGGVRSVVVGDNLLANLSGGVTRAAGPVNDSLVVVQHPRAIERGAVVAGVVTDGSETHAGNVLHVDVVDATVESAVIGAHAAAIVVVALGKPDLHVGFGVATGLDVHRDLADVDLGGERVATLRVGLAIGSVGSGVGRDGNTLKAVHSPVAGREVVAERSAVTHLCGIRRKSLV